MKYYFLLFFLYSSLFSFNVGNPSFPKIFKNGFFLKNKNINIRFGYIYNNIYQSKYKDEITTEESTPSFFSIQDQNGIIIFNLFKKIDFFTTFGASKIKLEADNNMTEIKTDENFSYCVGLKLLFLKKYNFDIALDMKYFNTKQACDYLIVQKKIFPIITKDFGFKYEELQGSLGISYKIEKLIPYIAFTYLYSKIDPYPTQKGLIRYPYPMQDIIDDFLIQTLKNTNNWGIALGSSLTFSNSSISIEARLIDQNGINLTYEGRF